MRTTHTHTYAILLVAPRTYFDCRLRLQKAWAHAGGVFESEYLGSDDRYGELLIFGTTAFAIDPDYAAQALPTAETSGAPFVVDLDTDDPVEAKRRIVALREEFQRPPSARNGQQSARIEFESPDPMPEMGAKQPPRPFLKRVREFFNPPLDVEP
jgi:hypothetical protein